MSLEYWFMFPVSVMIAMAAGVEGTTYFAPRRKPAERWRGPDVLVLLVPIYSPRGYDRGMLGSHEASRILQLTLKTGLGILFVLVALLTLGQVTL